MADIIGKMNQHITLRQATGYTTDGAGGKIPTFTDVGPIWANAEYRKTGSGEQQLAGQKTAFTAVDFTIRNNPSRVVTAKDKIIYREQTFEILSVLEHDLHRSFLLIETKLND